jgi:hypothetical protein
MICACSPRCKGAPALAFFAGPHISATADYPLLGTGAKVGPPRGGLFPFASLSASTFRHRNGKGDQSSAHNQTHFLPSAFGSTEKPVLRDFTPARCMSYSRLSKRIGQCLQLLQR